MRAINAALMRQINQKLILNRIRISPISRSELADEIGLTRASVTQNIDTLIREKIVIETESVDKNKVGRRNTLLAIDANARYIFGLNLRRTQIDIGVINMHGDVLSRKIEDISGRNVQCVLDDAAEYICRCMEQLNLSRERIIGIGVCAPGPLDPQSGIILNPPNFSAWHHLDIAHQLEMRTGLTVRIDNISNANALNEMYFGGARNLKAFLLIRVDEGVGSGCIINGHLYHGARNFAAEIGHISLDPKGPLCACGNRGCLEKYIAIPELLKGTPFHSWNEVADRWSFDPEAERCMNQMTQYLSIAITNVINLFDVEKVIIGGDVAENSEELVRRLNPIVSRKILSPMDNPPIMGSKIPDYVQIGAMPAFDEFFNAEIFRDL